MQHPLLTGVVEVAARELGHRPGARARVDEHGEEGAVAQAHDMGGVHRRKQFSCVRNRDFRGLVQNCKLFPTFLDYFTAFLNEFSALSITAERTYSSPVLARHRKRCKNLLNDSWSAAQR